MKSHQTLGKHKKCMVILYSVIFVYCFEIEAKLSSVCLYCFDTDFQKTKRFLVKVQIRKQGSM